MIYNATGSGGSTQTHIGISITHTLTRKRSQKERRALGCNYLDVVYFDYDLLVPLCSHHEGKDWFFCTALVAGVGVSPSRLQDQIGLRACVCRWPLINNREGDKRLYLWSTRLGLTATAVCASRTDFVWSSFIPRTMIHVLRLMKEEAGLHCQCTSRCRHHCLSRPPHVLYCFVYHFCLYAHIAIVLSNRYQYNVAVVYVFIL